MKIRQIITKYLLHYSKINLIVKERDRLKLLALSLLSRNAIIIYSIQKSGSTFLSMVLSNYINYLYGNQQPLDYDMICKYYCIRDIHKIDFENRFLQNKIPDYSAFILTHIMPDQHFSNKIICVRRDVRDLLISWYYFFYINRGIKLSHPRNIIKDICPIIASNIKKQNELYKTGKAMIINYEDLINNTINTFLELLDWLNLDIDIKGLYLAIEASSKDKIKEMEKNRGEAIVKKDGIKFNGSFIRSGKIGEWMDYFNKDDVKLINKTLKNSGL